MQITRQSALTVAVNKI